MNKALCLPLLVLAPLVALPTAGWAQPGQTEPRAVPDRGPRLVPPPLPVSESDRRLITQGEITVEAHVVGAGVGLFVGFGLGHAVQGRWLRSGWIYTVAEVALLTTMFYGLNSCIVIFNEEEQDCLVAGIGFYGFMLARVIEIGDTLFYPPGYNRRVREAKSRANYYVTKRPRLHLGPTKGGGIAGGVSFSF